MNGTQKVKPTIRFVWEKTITKNTRAKQSKAKRRQQKQPKKNTKEKAKTESTKQSNESTTNYRRKMHSNWVAQCITNTQQQSSVQIFTLQIEITNKQCKICYCLYPIWFIWKWNVHHCDCPLWIFFLLTHVMSSFSLKNCSFHLLIFCFHLMIAMAMPVS